MHARLDHSRVSLLTRTGLDWTRKYPSIAAALSVLPAEQAYLDGEFCGIRSDGKTSFSTIQAASDSGKPMPSSSFCSTSSISMAR
jgi:bifunctional non-homologous end joining protein LigD